MPIYEYFCRSCNARYEKLRPMSDADVPIACPTCSEHNSVRTLSVVIMHNNSKSTNESPQAVSYSQSSGGCCGVACGCHNHN